MQLAQYIGRRQEWPHAWQVWPSLRLINFRHFYPDHILGYDYSLRALHPPFKPCLRSIESF